MEQSIEDQVIDSVFSGENILLTGAAGCGKTTIENSMKLLLESDTVCLGSTGLAALLNGGMTSHKALSMPFGIPLEEDYNAFWSTASKTTKTLFGPKSPITRIFFDEVGMTTSYQMHWMDFALKKLYRTDKPFGGLQVCLFGDVSQLEPVVKSQERPFIMNSFGGLNFFESSAFIDGNFKIYNLKEVKRQDNQEMIKHLNNIRVYGYNFNLKESLDYFNDQCLGKPFEDSNFMVTTNARCDEINKQKFSQLNTNIHKFKATRKGQMKETPAPEMLELREGCRVIILKNHPDKLYVNGSVGIVHKINKFGVEVLLENGKVVDLDTTTWENYSYDINSEGKLYKKKVGSYSQYPLRLAYSSTIHKNQGVSCDSANIDLGKRVFASGMTYVALSRVRTIEGIRLLRPLNKFDVIENKAVLDFYKKHQLI